MRSKRKVILKSPYAVGDIVLLTAVVRDLHQAYPGEFVTDVRTSFPAIWEHNPYLTPLRENDPEVEIIRSGLPTVYHSNQVPFHCLSGFIDDINHSLGISIRPTAFKGDIHLSEEEKSWPGPMADLAGEDIGYWLVSAGGKYDLTIKWWDHPRYQAVIDHYRKKLPFIQVGQAGDYHPKLQGAVDLRGKTTLRQLIRLVYHAQGVLCGVTSLMHLAAAVESTQKTGNARPCVVVAGGREPPHWEAYPHHQVIHTVGSLWCCANGGCWKTRTRALGDGTKYDRSDVLCQNRRGHLAACMDMITSSDVIRRIQTYLEGDLAEYQPAEWSPSVERAIAATEDNVFDELPLTPSSARIALEAFIPTIPHYPSNAYHGRGIVICAGGASYFTNAWVCINMLRRWGCTLPIEVWHHGESELDARMESLLTTFDVHCVDAAKLRRQIPVRRLSDFALKPYAILHSQFQEVLLLDADNIPLFDPESLFEREAFKETGAIFWPDYPSAEAVRKVWRICNIRYRKAPPFETGQVVVDKARHWRGLCLTMWLNEHSDFFYDYTHGDKETFHLAFRKLEEPFSMPDTPLLPLRWTMCQHDFDGSRIFQHRNLNKWRFTPTNIPTPDFWYEQDCLHYLNELRKKWDGAVEHYRPMVTPRPARAETRSRGSFDIRAFLVSDSEETALVRRTLQRLAMTDWGAQEIPVYHHPVYPRSYGAKARKNGMLRLVHRALVHARKTGADFILLLQDDLAFNRYLRHNLENWDALLNPDFALASLYNPGLPELSCNLNRNLLVASANHVHDGQALLLSSKALNHILEQWNKVNMPWDLKIPRLASDIADGVYLHTPSLVQHVSQESVWDNYHFRAVDFQEDWKA